MSTKNQGVARHPEGEIGRTGTRVSLLLPLGVIFPSLHEGPSGSWRRGISRLVREPHALGTRVGHLGAEPKGARGVDSARAGDLERCRCGHGDAALEAVRQKARRLIFSAVELAHADGPGHCRGLHPQRRVMMRIKGGDLPAKPGEEPLVA